MDAESLQKPKTSWQQLAEKDAEIERLKADWRQQAETAQLRLQKIESQQQLITELCDAMGKTDDLSEVGPTRQGGHTMRNAPVDSEVYKAAMTAKDAEIERLKELHLETCIDWKNDLDILRPLITELCDALEAYTPDAEGGYRKAKELIRRAREATR